MTSEKHPTLSEEKSDGEPRHRKRDNSRPETDEQQREKEHSDRIFIDPREFFLDQFFASYVVFLTAVCFTSTLYFTLTSKTNAAIYFYEAVMIYVYSVGLAAITVLFLRIRISSSMVGHTEEKVACEQRGQSSPMFVTGEGFNLYLKAGLLMFCCFSILYNIVRIVGVLSVDLSKCGGHGFVVVCFLQAIFLALQSAFIVKHDKVIFMGREAVIRFCLTHLFVTNLCSWLHASIGEISEATVTFRSHRQNNNSVTEHQCENAEKKIGAYRPYLLPAIIEYSLLGGPMILELLLKCGNFIPVASSGHEESYPFFYKSKRGLVIGVLGIALCVSAVVAFYVIERKSVFAALLIFHTEGIIFGLLALIMSVIVYYKLKEFKIANIGNFIIDKALLWVSLFGTLMYYIIALKSSVDGLLVYQTLTPDVLVIISLELVMAVVIIIGSVFQTIIILSGMYRVPIDGVQLHEKPARPYVTVLLCLNLALWIIDTFQVKKSTLFFSSNEIPSHDGAMIISVLHIVLPLCILFRFHSTVCLSSIWSTAFSRVMPLK